MRVTEDHVWLADSAWSPVPFGQTSIVDSADPYYRDEVGSFGRRRHQLDGDIACLAGLAHAQLRRRLLLSVDSQQLDPAGQENGEGQGNQDVPANRRK